MALSSILSTFFITPIFHIFEKWIKILKIPVSFLLFVNDGLFISQERSFDNTNTDLFYSYNIMSSLLEQFELVVEHRKTEIFHFSRSHGFCYPLSLDLSWIGGPILYLKGTWQYLGFIFNRKLTFWQHTKFYANKAVYGQMHENACSTEYVFFQLLYMGFLFGITTGCHYHILLKSSMKYNDKWHFGYKVPFVSLLLWELRPLVV